MKHHTFIFLFLFVLAVESSAQTPKVIPSSIFIIDQQTGAQVLGTSEAANAFKNAFVALVSNTNTAKIQQTIGFGPGKRSFYIQQLSPQDNGNAYQLSLQRTFLGQVNVVYTFLYNVDQNKLYFSDPNTATWVEEVIQGYNMVNLNNCQTLGVFNEAQQQQAAVADNNQQAGNGIASDNTDATPVDDNVSAPAAPPALPDYEQPECPEDGYLWQPGYWAYNTDAGNYYWVPGVWVAPPQVGFLWTPPYWGYVGGVYAFHAGYWGNTIGFYGGVAYGFGYEGIGFAGGDWYGGHFRYNTAVVRVSTNVHNTFADARVVNRAGMRNHNSFNGPGGINARPTANELKAEHEHHVMVTPEQVRNQRAARSDRMQAAGAGGKPGNLANQKAPERVVTTGNRGGGGVGNGARNSNQAGMGRPGNSNQNAAVRPGGQGNGVRPGGPGNGAAPGQQGNGVRPGGPGAAQAQQGNGARPGAPGAGVRQGTPTAGNRPGAPTGNARQGSPAGNAKPAKTVNKPMSNSKPKNKN